MHNAVMVAAHQTVERPYRAQVLPGRQVPAHRQRVDHVALAGEFGGETTVRAGGLDLVPLVPQFVDQRQQQFRNSDVTTCYLEDGRFFKSPHGISLR